MKQLKLESSPASQEKKAVRQIGQMTRRASLLACFFLLLWYIASSFYFEEEVLLPNDINNAPKEEDTDSLLPIPLSPPPTGNEIDALEELNIKFCGQPTCKILFAYFLAEQETRANLHFRSFSQLADALNRTMILTNVGKSRINSCGSQSFDTYYNTDALQKEFPNVKFKSLKDFRSWLQERDQIRKMINREEEIIPPLSVLHSDIFRDKIVHPETFRDKESEKLAYKSFNPSIREIERIVRKGCLHQFEPSLNLTNPENSHVKYTLLSMSTPASSREVSNFIVDKFTTGNEDIILAKGYVISSLFPKVMPVLPYADHLINEAEKIKNTLSSSYIGIHWRLEQARPRLLPECVDGLIKTIDKIMKEHGIKNIYLATDYPLTSTRSQSSTFRQLTHYHHEAIRKLNDTYKINTWVSLGGLDQMRKDEKYQSEFTGAGMSGILDKLVCIKSTYFISGPKGCSRFSSSFTKIIASSRSDIIKREDDHGLLNVMDRWRDRKSVV